MNVLMAGLLAQMDPSKLDGSDPRIGQAPSFAITWIIIAVFVLGILAVTFKMSKRTAVKND